MRRLTLLAVIALLFALLAIIPVRAQDAASLDSLDVRLWPEFDDPRLLVIIDGQPSVSGETIVIPVPAQAMINAVASADATGRFVDNEYALNTEKTLISMIPDGASFRVEYYIPMDITGDKRLIDLVFPSGYFNADQATIEILLPPDSTDVKMDPATGPGEETAAGATLFVREIGPVAADQSITQNISYSNPTGALTMSEAPATQPPPVQETSSSQAPSTSLARNPLLIPLATLAVVLIGAGIYGLWRTRSPETTSDVRADEKPNRKTRATTRKHMATGQDRFCRQCGTVFGEGDRFCRKCGAKRL